MPVFIDTNILVYADDESFPVKQKNSAGLIAETYRGGTGVISSQVMQEYYNVAILKLKLAPPFAAERLRFFSKFQVVSATPQLVLSAALLHQRLSVSFWDAMILQAAIISGCNALYSEDLNQGEIVAGVKIINPFAKPRGAAVTR